MRKLSGYGPSLIVLVTATLVLLLGPGVVRQLAYKQTEARIVQARHRLATGNILAQINEATRDVASLVEPSVVHISAQGRDPARRGVTSLSTGSGWLYDEDGHVVTNFHVVRDADRIDVQLVSGEIRPAEIVGFDRSTDIAVLRIAAGQLHAAERALVTEPVQQGDLVFAFGSPFDFRFSMSSGIVSGKGRSVDVLGPAGYENFIQVDAAINPGNSGGPLTDYRGRVIGMNTAIATGRSASLEEGQFAGVGLAIPLEMIEPVVDQIIDRGFVEKGLLGVVPGPLNVIEAQRLGFIGGGVVIRSVEAGLPADRAGVLPEDIVTRVNDTPVETPAQLRSIVSSVMPGETVRLTIWRYDPATGEGHDLELSVRLIRLDSVRHNGVLPEDQPRDRILQIGIAKMSTASAELAEEHGVEYHPGVMIERTVPGSTLAADVPPGTTVVNVQGYTVENLDEFFSLLRVYNLRTGVRVGVVLPDGSTRSVVLAVDG